MSADAKQVTAVQKSAPDVAFVVPAKDEELRIGRCLHAINSCIADNLVTETIVVDNGSSDGTVEIAHEYAARVIERPGESISALRNVGVMSTRAPLVAFIDADVIIAPDWLINATREISRDSVAMVGASPNVPADATWVTRTWHLQIQARAAYGTRDWLASMNIMVRRDAFLEIGGFDESLETCEDVDLGYRMSRRYRIISDRRIAAIHLGEASTLRGLFEKEAWRGRANYSGAKRHGFEPGEIPSLVQPPLTLFGLVGLIVSIPIGSTALATLSLASVAAYPGIRSVSIARRSGKWLQLPQLFVVWIVYSIARTLSLLKEVRQGLRRTPA